MMDRSDCEALVAPHVVMVEQYQAVSAPKAHVILGDEKYQRLLRDKVRGLGPVPGTFYPWNVVDYLQIE